VREEAVAERVGSGSGPPRSRKLAKAWSCSAVTRSRTSGKSTCGFEGAYAITTRTPRSRAIATSSRSSASFVVHSGAASNAAGSQSSRIRCFGSNA
jgi:hypothetical protein